MFAIPNTFNFVSNVYTKRFHPPYKTRYLENSSFVPSILTDRQL